MNDDNPFFEVPQPLLPDEVYSETYVIHAGYKFRKVVKSMKRKSKRRVEERFFCIEAPNEVKLPAKLLSAQGYGYKSISSFHSARIYWEANVKDAWKQKHNLKYILNK